jgi:clan AA aspartic protease
MSIRPANYRYRRTKDTSLTGGQGLGSVYAEIELVSFDDLVLSRHGILPENEVRSIRRTALVDSGSLHLVVNEEVKQRLDLRVRHKRLARLADETVLEVEMVGPVEVRFENRSTTVLAAVLPSAEEILLGVIPLEGLDVFIDPTQERLVVNPNSPDTPTSQIKHVSLSI